MPKPIVEAVLRDSLTAGGDRSDSDPATHPFHQLKTTLRVPREWIAKKTFDAVELRFVGSVRTRILFSTCSENVIGLTGHRQRDDFRASGTRGSEGEMTSATRLTFAVPNLAELPPTLSETSSVYIPRAGGFGGQLVHGFCIISYSVEARLLSGSRVISFVSTPVIIAKRPPLCIAMPPAVQMPAEPVLPRIVRKALSTASPEDLQVRMFEDRTALLGKNLRSGARTLSVPVTILLRESPHRESRMTRAPLKCAVDARFFTTLRIGTEPMKNSQRLLPVVHETTKWSRERQDVIFPPFCAKRAAATGTADEMITYATTTDVEVALPDGLEMRSIRRGLYERTYELRLSVSIDAGPDVPHQTAHGSGILNVMSTDPCKIVPGAGLCADDCDNFGAFLGADVLAPPPAYAHAMRDPIVLITA